MNKIQLLTRVMGRLRKEKTPPLTRYAICLAVSNMGEGGATIPEIEKQLGDVQMGGTISALAEGPVPLLSARPAGPEGRKRVFLTEAGIALVADLLDSSPKKPGATGVKPQPAARP